MRLEDALKLKKKMRVMCLKCTKIYFLVPIKFIETQKINESFNLFQELFRYKGTFPIEIPMFLQKAKKENFYILLQ